MRNTSLLKRGLDHVAYPVAVLGPLSSLDQVFSIWNAKSADGVSAVVWTVLFFTSTFWVFYGAVHREKVIFFGHLIWLTLSATILAEILFFS